MDKRFAFIGVVALIMLLLSSFAIAQSENSDLVDMLTQIWESIAGTETADETTETIETPMTGESLEEDIISGSEIATQEGETATHETKESVIFEVVPVEEYNISLYAGWNLISTPYQLVNETLNSFLENVEGEWNLMWLKSKDYCGPPYFCWLSNKVGVKIEINVISNLPGYWINLSESITEDDNITAIGIHYYKEIEIPLYNSTWAVDQWDGWNMIGYPRNATISVENFLNDSLGSNWTLLETYETGEWLYAIESTPEPLRDTVWTLRNVTPGKGYVIKMIEDDILIIPETTKPY